MYVDFKINLIKFIHADPTVLISYVLFVSIVISLSSKIDSIHFPLRDVGQPNVSCLILIFLSSPS